MSIHQKLLDAMNDLQTAATAPTPGPRRAWSQRVDKILAELAAALQCHAQEIAAADGALVDVDRPLIPSPTLQHRASHLAQELRGVLDETRSLRRKLQALVPPANQPGHALQPAARSAAPENSSATDVEVFCQRARELVQALERCESQETDLIQESVTTDIGAGD